ncbi:hypothetical protein Nmel_015621 [Mimus melanotis]
MLAVLSAPRGEAQVQPGTALWQQRLHREALGNQHCLCSRLQPAPFAVSRVGFNF